MSKRSMILAALALLLVIAAVFSVYLEKMQVEKELTEIDDQPEVEIEEPEKTEPNETEKAGS